MKKVKSEDMKLVAFYKTLSLLFHEENSSRYQ